MVMRLLAIVIGSHVIRWFSERLYYEHCAGFVTSIFAYASPTCQGLRWIADTVATNTFALVGAASLKAIEACYTK
jgi:hypothetical protein